MSITKRSAFYAGLCVALVATTPLSADAIWDGLKARADQATPPNFERSLKTGRITASKTTSTTSIDRFQSREEKWTLVTVDGQTPTDKQKAKHQKETSEQPVPGFHRLSALLGEEPDSISRKGSQLIYHWPRLAKGALGSKGPDISRNLSAQAIVDTSGSTPALSQVRVYAKSPFSVMVVARIRSFDAVSTYETGADGTPFLVRQETQVDASIPFQGSGITHTIATFQRR